MNTLKKFSRPLALAGDEKRSLSFSAAFSPAFFHITGQKSKRRKRVKKKKTHIAETMEITHLHQDPESELLSHFQKSISDPKA